MFCVCTSNCLDPAPYLSIASLITNPLPGPCLRLSAPFCRDSWFQSYAELRVAADRTAQKHSMERKLHCNCVSSAGILLLYVLWNSEEAGNYWCCEALWIEGKGREGSYSKVFEIFQSVVCIMTQRPLKPMQTLSSFSFLWIELQVSWKDCTGDISKARGNNSILPLYWMALPELVLNGRLSVNI